MMRGMPLPQSSNFVIVLLSIQILCTLSRLIAAINLKERSHTIKRRPTQPHLDEYYISGGKFFINLKHVSTILSIAFAIMVIMAIMLSRVNILILFT